MEREQEKFDAMGFLELLGTRYEPNCRITGPVQAC